MSLYECKECNLKKYPGPSYDTGAYGVPVVLECKVHDFTIHFSIVTYDALDYAYAEWKYLQNAQNAASYFAWLETIKLF